MANNRIFYACQAVAIGNDGIVDIVEQTDGDGSEAHVVKLATGWMADNADHVDAWILEAAGGWTLEG